MSTRTIVLCLAAAVSLVASAAGCGDGSDGEASGPASSSSRSSEPARPQLCRPGASVLPAIPSAPGWWQEGDGAPLALACLRDDRSGGAALVGFAFGKASCVVPYGFEAGEAADERCTEPGTSWTIQCEGTLGCTSAFAHERGLTQLDGPVDARVRRVEVSVDGEPFRSGVMFASVKGKLMRAIGAREPFGFFYVAIPRCVAPAAVRVELLGGDGSRLGTAQGWDVAVESCRKLARRGAPSA